MALHHRKFLLEDKTDKKYPSPSCYICYICPKDCYLSPPPQPLESKSHRFSVILIIMLCLLGAVFLFLSYLTIVKHRSRRRNREPVEHGDFVGQNQWPVLDHPVWYIRTVGLPQSTIDSISKFEYKKNEGLIEGSDCAVCLNEFRENESLRLLPKCSHAFHVPCIDTWLRSHKNCPICRAPVLIADANNNNNNNSVGLSLINSVSTEENRARDVSESQRDENNAENHSADINSSKSGLNFDQSDKQIRVLSDLADHRSVKFDRKLEHPMRRSVSMDFSSASTICRVIKSSSIGRSLEKGPVSMKRSFSFSGKRSMRKSSRSMESISISIPEISTQNRNQ